MELYGARISNPLKPRCMAPAANHSPPCWNLPSNPSVIDRLKRLHETQSPVTACRTLRLIACVQKEDSIYKRAKALSLYVLTRSSVSNVVLPRAHLYGEVPSCMAKGTLVW